MPRPFYARRLSRAIVVTVALAALCTVSPPTIAAPAEAVPVPGDQLTGSGAVNRTELTAGQLTEGAATDTVPGSAFALPAQAAPPTHSFEGTLTLNGLSTTGGFRVLKDPYGYGDTEATRHLPPVDIALVQNGSHLVPVKRGLQYTGNQAWNLAVGPGRAWNEDGDGERTRASLPFALVERNANCVHNGALTFLFDATSVSEIRYQITTETCEYFQLDMWGQVPADYRPGPVDGAENLREAYASEVGDRLPTKPVSALATDYPDSGVDVAKFSAGITPSALSTFGFYFGGVHYVGNCRTRQGEYPFCGQMLLPSYSTAKSAFAGTAMLRLAKRYGPAVAQERLSDRIPETAGNAAWSGVTLDQSLDMATGNFISPGYEADEAGPTMADFFAAEPYADKMRLALSFPRNASPGSLWAYHTSDTFLATRAMTNYLHDKAGSDADIFDMLREDVLEPVGVGPDSLVSSRTDNSPGGEPFGGYGMFWTQDSVARFAKFLNNDHGAVNGTQILDPALLTATLQRDPEARGMTTTGAQPMKYQNGFWGREFTSADNPAYTSPFYVPFMSGYGGITVAMMPNGATYYYFSDNNEFSWSAAVAEAAKLAPMPVAAVGAR
ncbi:serine hydrolase domain-containing protein [Rhodococcus opacus]|uniref:hypothetical protein n=1 Tax=Rhodococcus opacus TaxID=37919 RepID=UPI002953A4F4|nr:hypothetical protein [Rhodococcus opacus]MDV7090363.1 hypothetical protein [Rhodococcus opacus]